MGKVIRELNNLNIKLNITAVYSASQTKQKFQRWLCTPQLVGLLRCRPCGCAPPCWYQPSWRRAAGGGGEEQLGRMCSAELHSWRCCQL